MSNKTRLTDEEREWLANSVFPYNLQLTNIAKKALALDDRVKELEATMAFIPARIVSDAKNKVRDWQEMTRK